MTIVADTDLPDSSDSECDSGTESDASDASFSSGSSTVSLPRSFPFVTLNDLGDLAHRQAIAEIWVEYVFVCANCHRASRSPQTNFFLIQDQDLFIKWTRFWLRRDTSLSSQASPGMIVDINHRRRGRRDNWSHWHTGVPCYELSDLEEAAAVARRAARKEYNLIRVRSPRSPESPFLTIFCPQSKRLSEWAKAAKNVGVLNFWWRPAGLNKFYSWRRCCESSGVSGTVPTHPCSTP